MPPLLAELVVTMLSAGDHTLLIWASVLQEPPTMLTVEFPILQNFFPGGVGFYVAPSAPVCRVACHGRTVPAVLTDQYGPTIGQNVESDIFPIGGRDDSGNVAHGALHWAKVVGGRACPHIQYITRTGGDYKISAELF